MRFTPADAFAAAMAALFLCQALIGAAHAHEDHAHAEAECAVCYALGFDDDASRSDMPIAVEPALFAASIDHEVQARGESADDRPPNARGPPRR